MNKGKSLKLVSWNVNGLRAIEKKGFVDMVLEIAPDIIGIQETKALPEQLASELKNIPGYQAYWNSAGRKGYAGTCVYARQEPLRVTSGLGLPELDQEGRLLTLEYDDYFFITAYFPNAQPELKRLDFKLTFNRAVHNFVDRLSREKTVVICGDFNVAHKPIDLAHPEANENSPGYSAPERAWLDDFVGAGYLDTFRKFNKEPEQYTWWSYRTNARARNIGWRIDYFFVDPTSENRVRGAAILDRVMGSDHCPVSIDFI